MTSEDIQQRVTGLRTNEDLLCLLNQLKEEDLGHDKYAFTMRQLNYYCNPNNTRRRYTSFEIKKKSGGVRKIDAPRRGLKNILYYLNQVFQSIYIPSSAAMGFVVGKSVVDNAQCHIGKNYVFNIDLKDFFPSITQPRVWKRLQLKPLNISQPIANIIAGLCCMKKKEQDGTVSYILPQGAPTSPIITNMICDKLDRRLKGLAARFNLTYTRYADDITFSSNHYVYAEDGDFRKELERIIADQGFSINENKTRLQKKGSRQEVTGLIVNEKTNLISKYVREIRSILYIWEKYGYMVADGRFQPRYKQEKGHVKKGNPSIECVLAGKLQYLKMVKGESNTVYMNLQNRFDALMYRLTSESSDSRQFTYISTMNVKQFEESLETKIEKGISKNNNDYFYFIKEGKRVAIKTSEAAKEVEELAGLCISQCKGKTDGKKFYLLHKPIVQVLPCNTDDCKGQVLDNMLSELVESNFNLEKLLAYGTK